MNRATLTGRVGKDPEIRTAGSGKVANFSFATSERWKDKNTGERKEKTEWHNIVVWGDGLVNVVEQYVRKGDSLLLEGQIQTRKWQDQSGNDRYTTEIVLSGRDARLEMQGSKNDGGNAGGGQRQSGGGSQQKSGGGQQQQGEFVNDLDDEIPF